MDSPSALADHIRGCREPRTMVGDLDAASSLLSFVARLKTKVVGLSKSARADWDEIAMVA
jgi:hypothetical protein